MKKKNKLKVLIICSMGVNRSRYLASFLNKKGYNTRYGGLGIERKLATYLRRKGYDIERKGKFLNHVIYKKAYNPLKQKDIDWAEVIIVVRKKHRPLLKKRHGLKGKRLIVLDVTDSKGRIEKKFPELAKLNYAQFNNKWTYPQLRKAIKPYLPLKVK